MIEYEIVDLSKADACYKLLTSTYSQSDEVISLCAVDACKGNIPVGESLFST